MNKQFLSFLATGFMLSSVLQVKAMDPAAIFLAAQGMISAAQHIRLWHMEQTLQLLEPVWERNAIAQCDPEEGKRLASRTNCPVFEDLHFLCALDLSELQKYDHLKPSKDASTVLLKKEHESDSNWQRIIVTHGCTHANYILTKAMNAYLIQKDARTTTTKARKLISIPLPTAKEGEATGGYEARLMNIKLVLGLKCAEEQGVQIDEAIVQAMPFNNDAYGHFVGVFKSKLNAFQLEMWRNWLKCYLDKENAHLKFELLALRYDCQRLWGFLLV